MRSSQFCAQEGEILPGATSRFKNTDLVNLSQFYIEKCIRVGETGDFFLNIILSLGNLSIFKNLTEPET